MTTFDSVFSEVSQSVSDFIANNLRPFDGIETTATHGGFDPLAVPDVGRPVVAPIVLATTYHQIAPGVGKFEYTRTGNFTRDCLEKCIAALEGGDHCSVFGSGLAALMSVIQKLSAGDHIVASDELYGGTTRYLHTMAVKSNITFTMVNMRDEEGFRSAFLPNTRMVLTESPSNPLLQLVDIRKVCEISHSYNKDILVAVDNTFMSPYFQRPLEFGADISWSSLTKYMNGHSDVLMGAVVTKNRPDLRDFFTFVQSAAGAVPSPFDCYLCLRGIRTLPVRMPVHMKNALIVAMMLERHPKVEKVFHPGLKSHPQHRLALQQMRGFSGMMSFYIKANEKQTVEFVKHLKIFSLAVSLGGFESLTEVPSIMTHASVPLEIRQKTGVLDNLVRLSVGLENPKDLVKALYQGLDAIK